MAKTIITSISDVGMETAMSDHVFAWLLSFLMPGLDFDSREYNEDLLLGFELPRSKTSHSTEFGQGSA